MKTPRSLILSAFLAACGGVAFFSLMDAAMKGLALGMGAYNALLWRNVAGTVISGGAYAAARTGWPTRAVMRLHIWRGIIVAAMALLFFWALTILPMAEAVALSFIAPLIALFLAAMLLGEKIRWPAILASLLGLAGVCVIIAARLSDEGGHDPAALWGVAAVLGSAVLFAYNLILARQQAQLAKPAEIAFFSDVDDIGDARFCCTLGGDIASAQGLAADHGGGVARCRLVTSLVMGLCQSRGANPHSGRIYGIHLGRDMRLGVF